MRSPLILALSAAGVLSALGEAPAFIPSPITAAGEFPKRLVDSQGQDSLKDLKGPFAEITRELFALGLPDPVGQPYRKIRIPTGSCWGGGGCADTEGWVLKQDDRSFAIAWNGLIYPLVEDLGAADLAATAERIKKAGKGDHMPFPGQLGESREVAPEEADLMHGVFLTRFGFAEAATALLKQRDHYLADLRAPLLETWAWNLYDRAVQAHMRGDPRLALASLDELLGSRPKIEARIKEAEPERKDFAWEPQLTLLRDECLRRIEQGKTGSFDEATFLATNPGIPAIIEALDRIQIAQMSQPGGVDLGQSKLVRTLVAKGDEAMEPLIQCLESDPRLTQSMHFWRDFSMDRTVLGVQEAALIAIEQLLLTNFYEIASTSDSLTDRGQAKRKELAATVRDQWESKGKATGVHLSYRILADDTAGYDRWLDACTALFQQIQFDEEAGKWATPTGPIPGEVLREKQNPSVSDLLDKRLKSCMKAADGGDKDARRTRLAFLAILLDWDEPKGKASIAEQAKRWMADEAWKSEEPREFHQFLQKVAGRVPEVLPIVETVLWSLGPSDYGYDSTGGERFVSQMMAAHGDSPLMKHKAKELWTDPDSPWSLGVLHHSDLSDLVVCWRHQELLKKEPFRSVVLDMLKDDSRCGRIFILKEDPKHYASTGSDGLRQEEIPKDPKFALKPGDEWSIRRKDVVAHALKKQRLWADEKKEPNLEFYWSPQDRDAWIETAVAELKKADK